MSKHAATGGAPWGRGRSGLAMLAVALLGLALVASLLVSAPSANSAEGDPTATSTGTPTGTASSGPSEPGDAGVPNTVWAASPPVLIDPERNATLNPRLDLVFTWSTVPGATTYEMQIALSDKFTAPTLVFPEGSVTTTSTRYALVSELAPGEYWWRVRGLSERGRTGWSKQIPFQVSENSPAVPGNLRVISSAFNAMEFRWDGVPGASEYQIQFSRSAGTNDLVDVCSTPHTALTPLFSAAVDFKGSTQGQACNILGYRGAVKRPGMPEQVTPIVGTSQVLLAWLPPADDGGAPITGYVVQYSTDSGATWRDAPGSPTASTQLLVAPLANGVPVIFRVAAVNIAGRGPFSDPTDAVTPGTVPETPSTAPTPRPSETGVVTEPLKVGETGFLRVRAVDYRVEDYSDGLTTAFDPYPPANGLSIRGFWSRWVPFTVGEATSVGGALSPAFEQQFLDNPVLSWASQAPLSASTPLDYPDDLPTYQIALATDRNFVNTIAQFQTQNTRLIAPGVLVDDNSLSYFWCVLPPGAPADYDAQDFCGNRQPGQQAGVTWSAFRKRGDPVTIRKTQKQSQQDNITFEWNEYPPSNGGTSKYCLQITANAAEFEDNGDCEDGGSVESFVTDNYTYVVVDDALYGPGVYYWRVAAVDSADLILPWSGVQFVRVSAAPPPNPRVPSIVGTRGGFKVSWTGPVRLPDAQYVWTNDGGPNITGFRVSWKRGKKGTWKRQSVSPNVSSLTMTGLPSGVTLRVVVQSENAKGFSRSPNAFIVRTR